MSKVNILNELIGKTFTKVERDGDEIIFYNGDTKLYKLYREQDCCESVWIESVVGDLSDLENSPILMAEYVTEYMEDVECGQYTFYKFATLKGYVDIRWCGESNGYYSIDVDFLDCIKDYERKEELYLRSEYNEQSTISLLNDDGSIDSVFTLRRCSKLYQVYPNIEQVKELILMGDMLILSKNIEWCTFYHRDMGRDLNITHYDNIDDYFKNCQSDKEHFLFKDNQWYFYDGGNLITQESYYKLKTNDCWYTNGKYHTDDKPAVIKS